MVVEIQLSSVLCIYMQLCPNKVDEYSVHGTSHTKKTSPFVAAYRQIIFVVNLICLH